MSEHFMFPVYLCDARVCFDSDARCGNTATHRQAGRELCNAHLDNHPRAPRAFALND